MMKLIMLLVGIVQSVLILDGMSAKELGRLSVLHAYISPVIAPLIVAGDPTCVSGVRGLLLYQLGMIETGTLTFDDFCIAKRGPLEIKNALITDSSWVTYQNAAVQGCLDDFLMVLADKIIANRDAICSEYTSDADSSGKLIAMLALVALIIHYFLLCSDNRESEYADAMRPRDTRGG